jgi:HPt (histidine-containing phosphotransfer) domain-containing protein
MNAAAQTCDLTSALTRMAGDVELLKKLAEIFRADYPEIMLRLRDGIEAGRASAVQHEAHSLKGLVSYFSAEAASRLIIRLEEMGSLEELTGAGEVFKELECELSRLDRTLTVELSKL